MHQHSDKIQPKRLSVTIILTILFLVYAWYVRTNNLPEKAETNDIASTTLQSRD